MPRLSPEMLPRHHRAVGDYLQERLYRPESLLATGCGQKFIARGYHTTGDGCVRHFAFLRRIVEI